jgi:hypothetical protein
MPKTAISKRSSWRHASVVARHWWAPNANRVHLGGQNDAGKESRADTWRSPHARLDNRVPHHLSGRPAPILGGKAFTPSNDLVRLFRRGILAATELARQSPDFNQDVLEEFQGGELRSSSELASVLQTQIFQFFALVASRGRVHNVERMTITEGGNFTVSVEHFISINFLIRPADLTEFLKLLALELRSHIVRGGSFAGAWGKMKTDDANDLFMTLSGDRAPAYAPKEKARVLR